MPRLLFLVLLCFFSEPMKRLSLTLTISETQNCWRGCQAPSPWMQSNLGTQKNDQNGIKTFKRPVQVSVGSTQWRNVSGKRFFSLSEKNLEYFSKSSFLFFSFLNDQLFCATLFAGLSKASVEMKNANTVVPFWGFSA